jgi:NAD(P)-dependent dehydrogenase (short-subunit alcohol dehydrogenase family)
MSVYVVTGAAGALGSELVRVLSAGGASVALLGSPETSARLDDLAAHAQTGSCRAFPIDVTEPSQWLAVLPRIESELGPIDGAVLTAGGYRGGAPLHAPGSRETHAAMLQMNLETARVSLVALLPRMIERRAGSIVVIGSRAVERPWESANAAAYAASKAALVALARAVAAEVLEHGVRINAVLPSIIDTADNRRAMPAADPTRWVSASSLCAVIRFLLSEDARDVSGAAVPVYGRA